MENNIKEFSELYNFNKGTLMGDLPEKVNALRDDAHEIFSSLGFPTKKNENYKYTDINSIFNSEYKKHFTPKNISFNMDDVFKCDVPDLDTNVIVLLNGFFLNGSEKLKTLPSGAIIGSFAEASKKYPELIEKYYAKSAKYKDDSLVALNTAFAQDGAFIYVPKNAVVQKPIQIINLSMSDEDQFIQHRNLFILEPNSQFNLVVCDHTLSPMKFATNSVTEIYIGENSHFDLVKVQNEHNASTQLTSTFIHQEKNSNVSTNTITLHGGTVRNKTQVVLDGEGAHNDTLGLYLADKGQHVDNYVYINHTKPHCTSNQLFKGILDDFASGAFNGRIYVAKDAQQTEAFQSNNNILLTNDAKMNTKPQLEIYADDVKCSHGATVGQLDMDAFFYLRSRGIGEQEARMLLMFGFAHDVIDKIKIEPLRERIDELVEKRLRGELSRCNNCAMHCGEPC